MLARKNKIDTRLEIIQAAATLFLRDGFSATSAQRVAQEVGISTGNLTFHFPTKEHMLAKMIRDLCEYHLILMQYEVEEGKTSLLAYLMELTAMMAICDENAIAKDLYIAAYTHPLSLKIIRECDTEKTKLVFSAYQPNWTDVDFAETENIVSGIEYAALIDENTENISLEMRITRSLDAIMKLYEVPVEIRKQKIDKILNMDYRKIGRKIMKGFVAYVNQTNEQALEEAKAHQEEANPYADKLLAIKKQLNANQKESAV